ncbi:hypothetical protein [Phyllobacterium sp. P5_D12]
MPNDSDSISTEPSWIHSPASLLPLWERAVAKRAFAEADARTTNRRKLDELYDRAALKIYDKPGTDQPTTREVLAKSLRIIRASGKRQVARDLLQLFKSNGPGRPTADKEHYEIAEMYHAVMLKLRNERPGGRVHKNEVKYKVAQITGKSRATVERAHAKYGRWIAAREEAKTSLEDNATIKGYF